MPEPASQEHPFARDVRSLIAGRLDKSRMVEICSTPTALSVAGLKALPLFVRPSVLEKVIIHKHGLSPESVGRLPDELRNPVAIFKSDTRPHDSVVVVVDLWLENHPVVVAIAIGQAVARTTANVVTSVYSKQHHAAFEKWLKDGLLLWSDKKRMPAWLQSIGVQFPKEETTQAENTV